MYRYQRVFLIISLMFAMVAAFFAYEYLLFFKDVREDPKVAIPVAAVKIDALTPIQEIQVKYLEVSKASITNLNILTDKQDIIGKYAMTPIEPNSPFLKSNMIEKEMMTGPFHIPEGYRAITMKSSPLISVGGYLESGMFVDVLWTYGKQEQTRTVLAFQNIKVLAVGSPLDEEVDNDEDAKTITLLMTPADAQKLTLMTATGDMKLTLRPSQIEPSVQLPPVDMTNILR